MVIEIHHKIRPDPGINRVQQRQMKWNCFKSMKYIELVAVKKIAKVGIKQKLITFNHICLIKQNI